MNRAICLVKVKITGGDHACLPRCNVTCSDHESQIKPSRVRTRWLDEPNPICSGVLAVKIVLEVACVVAWGIDVLVDGNFNQGRTATCLDEAV